MKPNRIAMDAAVRALQCHHAWALAASAAGALMAGVAVGGWPAPPAASRPALAGPITAAAAPVAGVPSAPVARAVLVERSGSGPASAEATSAPAVQREGDEIVIAVHAVPRRDVARQLAALTATQLLESPEQLDTTPPITLHWRGADAAEAWRYVLADHVSHALRCGRDGCLVWIIAGMQVAATAGSAKPTHRTRPQHAAVLAQADETAPVERLPQADPPGLFPAE